MPLPSCCGGHPPGMRRLPGMGASIERHAEDLGKPKLTSAILSSTPGLAPTEVGRYPMYGRRIVAGQGRRGKGVGSGVGSIAKTLRPEVASPMPPRLMTR
ncbi:hypothetical protein EHYA_10237 [Embleya hyalina]|uniref:Uncharacterized protein n=1 Tax=Embleya hyalina TaxID=516124 RepID=A0A401Z6H3_9ACTN|nr:hypothetical protein EHYA_10237 [Embleya hyalina]